MQMHHPARAAPLVVAHKYPIEIDRPDSGLLDRQYARDMRKMTYNNLVQVKYNHLVYRSLLLCQTLREIQF